MHVAKETFEFSTSQSKDWSSTEWSEGSIGHQNWAIKKGIYLKDNLQTK